MVRYFGFFRPRDRLIDIGREEKKNNHTVECVDEFLEKIQRVSGLGFSAGSYVLSQLVQEDDHSMIHRYPSKAEQMEKLERALRSVDTDVNSQIMAFHSLLIEDIYQRKIIFARSLKFTFNSPTRNFFDVKANGTLFYELHLPYHNKKYEKTKFCVPRDDLAIFFSLHR